MEEPAIRRPIGSDGIRREQVRALVEAAHRPNVDLRVVPLANMRYALTFHGFTVMSFEEDPTYRERRNGRHHLLHQDSEADKYRDIFLRIQHAALDRAGSITLLNEVISEL